ncbi:hypothetical protein GCM10007874_68360 [Labrys miyagiensis]|uniref:Uncharacterized protein n=1 Tax=Labrys miyagiensis TaxID=346912 RepID=A0ABQ6CXQ8_9HYPH|nr:hypothetical protein GCM10007874_68360 [Labrys miyagiensis]
MKVDPKVLFSNEVVPPTPEEWEVLDAIIRDCEGSPYKAALTLLRLFALQSSIAEARAARQRRSQA